MALGVRGINPIWTEFDLQGNLFDDTFYLFVLENTVPYNAAPVYHDADLTTPWTNPINFLGNGTLPVDIFFESEKVYRLEFRQGPTQTDPLIYEVNDYVAGAGGSTPVDTVAFATSNQVTNPQFSLISFASPLSVPSSTNPSPLEVAPGWFLEVAGTGTIALERIALNDSVATPSNAPYALRLTLNGWDNNSVFLRQRFQQNGVLWANKIVSSAITARLEGIPQNISAELIDSNGATLAQVLTTTAVNEDWNEFTGYGQLGASTNPNTPPAAYIDYKLALPSNIDIYVTSFQLVVQDLPLEPGFEQDSIDRQIDHTFHIYRDSLLREQKESVLTGWDFGLNPWQAYAVGNTNLATFGYTADQTIMVQQAYVASATGNNISTARGTAAQNYGYKVTSVTASNKFSMIQYIDASTMRAGWGGIFSAMVKLNATLQSTPVRVKMKLIWRTTNPATLSQTEPVASWASNGEPIFASGWTVLSAINDPIYSLTTGARTLLFEGFQLPAASTANMTLGVVIYTLDNMVQTGTADNIIFNKVSLVQNRYAIDAPSLTFDETLRRCQFYLETSYPTGIALGTASTAGYLTIQRIDSTNCVPLTFHVNYLTEKRAAPTSGVVVFYSTNSGTSSQVYATARVAGGGSSSSDVGTANWAFSDPTTKGFSMYASNSSTLASIVGITEAFITFNWAANARLGVI